MSRINWPGLLVCVGGGAAIGHLASENAATGAAVGLLVSLGLTFLLLLTDKWGT